jgi:hypothetical protein
MRPGLAPLLTLCLAALPATGTKAQTLLDPQSVMNTGLDIAAAALANALVASRDAAWEAGTQPMPPRIRQALLAWYPADLLDSIEYRTGITEDASLQSLSMRYGEANAITLIDTIVFADPAEAETDVALWAHEVKHVEQVRRWGLMGFAQAYVRDHEAVEAEAYAIGAAVKAVHGGG